MKKLVLAKETVMRLQAPAKKEAGHPTQPTTTVNTIKSGCC
jgi:hypothetical protein